MDLYWGQNRFYCEILQLLSVNIWGLSGEVEGLCLQEKPHLNYISPGCPVNGQIRFFIQTIVSIPLKIFCTDGNILENILCRV
jgi:hypothetical protein